MLFAKNYMPASRINMRKLKDALRLKFDGGLSHQQIAHTLGISKGVVTKYVGLAVAAGLDWQAIAIMADALETGDAGYIAKALGVVARAKGMAEISAQTGLSREQLYRSFSEKGNPTLKTMLAVMKALGIDMTAKLHG
jgi:probable addiction module antidote protein